MNFCKSCSFEAISARCFKRSSLSVVREKYSSQNYSFRPPHTTRRGQPSRCCHPAFAWRFYLRCLKLIYVYSKLLTKRFLYGTSFSLALEL